MVKEKVYNIMATTAEKIDKLKKLISDPRYPVYAIVELNPKTFNSFELLLFDLMKNKRLEHLLVIPANQIFVQKESTFFDD